MRFIGRGEFDGLSLLVTVLGGALGGLAVAAVAVLAQHL